MGKQKHDLGVRKRAINEQNARKQRPPKTPPSFAIGSTDPEPPDYYGPPSDVRESAHALRQMGLPQQAQKVLNQHRYGLLHTSIPMHRQPAHNARQQGRNRR